jgi:hypothetical protein
MSKVTVFNPTFPRYGSWDPASRAQEDWLESRAEFLLGGGSCGSLKTSTMILDGTVEYDSSWMHTIMFRKNLAAHAEAIRMSRDWFSQSGATLAENAPLENGTGDPNYNATAHIWRWPWGSTFQFAFCEKDEDVYAHQSQSYTCILWDESTREASESMVRYMFTRLRSTEPSMFLRVRCGTNPGGRYADWHMKLFLGGGCPHCEPTVKVPGQIYRDAVWPSDQRSLGGKTTQFIFSRVTDHALLGDNYVSNIRMQHAATAEALLDGCWKAFEGKYYDIWDAQTMVVPRQAIRDRWYWEHWVGCDYGFSGSSAVAYLFARDPDSKIIYVLDEIEEQRMPVRDFARTVYERFAKKHAGQDQPRKLRIMYLSPDAWNDRGDQHTLAGQMNEVLRFPGLAFVRAQNDRAGGSMLLYEMLRNGRFVVADSCKLLRAGIESAEHDPQQPEAYLNVPNDPRSDARDAGRYGLYSYHREVPKPLEMRVEERIERELETGDLTSAMFRISQIREEERRKCRPTPYVRTGNVLRRQMAECLGKRGHWEGNQQW